MTTTPPRLIDLPAERLAAFCRRWGLACLEVFGSVLRDDFRAESDVDFLYTPGPRFNREQAFGPWGQNRMAEELAGIVGRPVDLVERSQIERHRNWIRRQHILQTAQPVYVEG
jgi:predicted nucleotidyltransferase